MKRRSSFAVFLCVGILWASALGAPPPSQQVLIEVRFVQLDWYDHFGALVQADSLWGRADFDYNLGDRDAYFNLALGNQETGEPVWAVQNLPVFPDGQPPSQVRTNSVYIDLEELGLGAGENWITTPYTAELTSRPLREFQVTLDDSSTVGDIERRASDQPSEPPDPGPFLDPGKPKGIKVDGKAHRIGEHRPFERLQEDDNHCAAGSFARSLGWLNQENGFAPTKDTQDFYDDLKDEGVSNSGADGGPNGNGNGISRDEWVESKDEYARDVSNDRIETKVWDSGNDMPAIDGIEESTEDFAKWLKGEIRKGEDVEIGYVYPGNAHIVAVTEVYVKGKKLYVKYRDDENQGPNNDGDDSEKNAEIYKDDDGNFHFGSDQNRIYFAVSESWVEKKGKGKGSD